MHKVSMRASEIQEEVLRRKQHNKEAMASKQKSNGPVEKKVMLFCHFIMMSRMELILFILVAIV